MYKIRTNTLNYMIKHLDFYHWFDIAACKITCILLKIYYTFKVVVFLSLVLFMKQVLLLKKWSAWIPVGMNCFYVMKKVQHTLNRINRAGLMLSEKARNELKLRLGYLHFRTKFWRMIKKTKQDLNHYVIVQMVKSQVINI